MTFNISNPIGTGTDAELLELTRAKIAEITMHGQANTIRGKSLQNAELASLRNQVEWLEARIASAEGGGNTTNYARRNRPA